MADLPALDARGSATRRRRGRRPRPSRPPLQDGAGCLAAFGRDVVYGVAAPRRAAGFTAVAVLTLALGIGANTAIFSVVNALLLAPLPFPEPDRLVMMWETDAADPADRRSSSPQPN